MICYVQRLLYCTIYIRNYNIDTVLLLIFTGLLITGTKGIFLKYFTSVLNRKYHFIDVFLYFNIFGKNFFASDIINQDNHSEVPKSLTTKAAKESDICCNMLMEGIKIL